MKVRDTIAYTLMTGIGVCLVIVLASRSEVVDDAAGIGLAVIIGIGFAIARWLNNESPSRHGASKEPTRR